jgi:hypothetical protein
MVLFMVTAIMMPLLMMNLLIAILGQAYVDVKEKWFENMYHQKVNIIYDLELLMLWNRNAASDKFHLLYAKNMKEDQDVSYRTLTKSVDDYHTEVTKGEKKNFEKIDFKIEKCKEEVKKTMQTLVKKQKTQLETII